MAKIAGSGSISQRHGSPDSDPHQNVMDLDHWYKDYVALNPVRISLVQGLPFLVGLLLMHLEEEEAFNLLKYLMFHLGLRNQFKPDMTGLQVRFSSIGG